MSLVSQLNLDSAPKRSVPRAMISGDEYAALAGAASSIWGLASEDAVIVDAGSFVGASTLALAEGLSLSTLTEDRRIERIWSYDLFRAIPEMADGPLKADGIAAGGSFRHLYDETISPFSRSVKTFEGNILEQPKPASPIAILFLDVMWNWDASVKLSDDFYPNLVPGRSILIHQDYVYPFYPWIIIGMELLADTFVFARNVQYSSVFFDVVGPYRPGRLDDIRNTSAPQALEFYDRAIGRLEGWAKGSVGLGKAFYLASVNRTDEAAKLVEDVSRVFQNEQLVMQYMPAIAGFVEGVRALGFAPEIGKDAVALSA